MAILDRIKKLVDIATQRQIYVLAISAVVLSIIETLSLASIMPFIEIVTDFQNVQNKFYIEWFYSHLRFENDQSFIVFIGSLLIILQLIRMSANLLFNFKMTNFSEHLYTQITDKIFQVYISMPYINFTKRNSSFLTKAIVSEAMFLSLVIRDSLIIISESLIAIFLYLLLILVDWRITLIFSIIYALKILIIKKTITKSIKNSGSQRAIAQKDYYEIVNKLFRNFKQTMLQSSERRNNLKSEFYSSVEKYSNSNSRYVFLNTMPKILLETFGFILIFLLIIIAMSFTEGSIVSILPTLSLFVIAMYRLLPSVNRIISSFHTIIYHHQSIEIITNELAQDKEMLGTDKINFSSSVTLQNVQFSYESENCFSNLNLSIKKGDKIAFIGHSGSGKSTILDLIMGILIPKNGEIKVDNVLLNKGNIQAWRSKIGYIPQEIFLFNGTVSENVCFGRKEDQDKLKEVLRIAKIMDFLEMKQGLDTPVGDAGVQLSGGQMQRIAIARAIYGDPEVLVLDEATSALDTEKEDAIMQEILQISKEKTLIISAHRLNTIKSCNKIYKVSNNSISLVSNEEL